MRYKKAMDFLFIIIVLIMSVVVHEVSHGYAALSLGDPTAKYQGRLTLNPISHLDPVGSLLVPLLGYLLGGFVVGWAKPVPFNPYNLRNQRWGEAYVAAAGPISNIILAIAFGLLLRLVGPASPIAGPVSFVVLINITLAIFNLVPIPPLDGSKILFGILPKFAAKFRYALESYGLILVFIFIAFLWQILIPVIRSLFLIIAGTGEFDTI